MFDNSKLFCVDEKLGICKSYCDFLDEINLTKSFPRLINGPDCFSVFKNITLSLIYQEDVILIDSGLSEDEFRQLGFASLDINNIEIADQILVESPVDILEYIRNGRKWRVTLFTSGTTGLPKKVTHSIETLTKFVKSGERRKNDVWGYAYNPTHVAGLQLFLQALLNLNTIVNLFSYTRSEIHGLIEKFSISNISATPTFYRLLLPADQKHHSVTNVTSGGEKFDGNLTSKLREIFPNSKLLNVYASTELGSLFAAKGDIFIVPEKLSGKVKIRNSTLWVHSSQVAMLNDISFEGEWYDTKDLVELVEANPLSFKFISRANEMINVGGYKVNPYEVEDQLNCITGILYSKVYAVPNSVVGNILSAEIVAAPELTELEIRAVLSKRLQYYKIPRIITFVDRISISRTGKTVR